MLAQFNERSRKSDVPAACLSNQTTTTADDSASAAEATTMRGLRGDIYYVSNANDDYYYNCTARVDDERNKKNGIRYYELQPTIALCVLARRAKKVSNEKYRLSNRSLIVAFFLRAVSFRFCHCRLHAAN